jgi:hypothetical protein
MTKRMWKLLPRNVRSKLKVDRGCWIWTGAVNGPWYTKHWGGGYGNVKHQGRTVATHRLVYAILVEPPAGILMHGPCRNRKCCKPNHLTDGTVSENAKEREAHR